MKTELIEQRKKLLHDAEQIVNKAKAEDRNLNADEQQKFDAMMDDADAISDKAANEERENRLDGLKNSLTQVARRSLPVDTEDRHAAERAFQRWALGEGERSISKSSASNTIPTTFGTELEKYLRYFFPVGQVVGSFNTPDGTNYPYPYVDDTSNVSAATAEEGTIGVSSDPTFGAVTFKAYDYYSPIVKVSNQAIRDSFVDFPALLAQLFSERMGVALENAVVSSNAGTSAPEGLLNGVTAGVALAAGNAITVAKLLSLESSVPIQYRQLPGVSFLMHDATWMTIRGLTDTTGRLLVNANLQEGVQRQLLGYPVAISNNMTSISSPGTTQPLILFGAMNKYKVRYIGSPVLTRLTELFAATAQQGFCLTQSWDGRWINKNGVRTLTSN